MSHDAGDQREINVVVYLLAIESPATRIGQIAVECS